MNTSPIIRFVLYLALTCIVFLANIWGQTPAEQPRQVNFRYSQNPKTKAKTEDKATQNVAETSKAAITNEIDQNNSHQIPEFESRSVAKKTLEIARRANAAVAPTENYKVGIGDVLFISLQNAPSKVSTYFTVLNDGKIDYPLAGEMIFVQDMMTEEIEDLLKEKIKLYENPLVSVKVREHSSHKISVFGLVENAGEKYLQREAIPLYVVRAEAVVQSKASQVVIKRANSNTETIDLKDSKSEDILIFPGDIVEFKSVESKNIQVPQFYYIGGNIVLAGQRDFYQGITLTQAILASGGLKKITAKTVVIRRKNELGLLSPMGFELKAIKDGKQPDPILQPGDTIEIEN